MNIELRILVYLSYSMIASALYAQETEKYYQDQQALKFRDGIYLNIDMVKKNSPIPSTWIETDLEVNDRDFYKKITKADEIVFYDDNGVRTVLDTKRIWGYSRNRDLHINVGGAYHKIDFVGHISHFRASKTTYDPFFYDEMNRPGFYWYSPPILTIKDREYLVDIVENKTWVFDSDGLEWVLKEDSVLLKEFRSLKKREKEYLKYIFLNRYNEKYPLEIQ